MRRPPTLTAAAVLAALTVPAAAHAAPLELGRGDNTRLRLAEDTLEALDSAGVRVRPTGDARGITLLRFPITGGRLDTATGAGSATHSGGLRFSRGARRLSVSAPTARIGRTSSISFRVGGRRATLISLDTSDAQVEVRGANLVISGAAASLTSTGARALNRALRTTAFQRGTDLGSVTVDAAPAQVVALRGGRTDLAFDPAAAAALAQAGVQFGPVPPAAPNADGSVGFPIARNSVVAAGLQTGTINHGGGLKLVKGAAAISITDYLVRLSAAPTLGAEVNYAGGRIAVGTLDLSAASPQLAGGSVTVGGVGVLLNAAGAAALNSAFGTAFTPGQRLATATVRATV
ncbi:MAG TPA: hypothetical protein VD931_09075 [Baekduia sp.]|nr:hypothetical protein [Baekduia sp.]